MRVRSHFFTKSLKK